MSRILCLMRWPTDFAPGRALALELGLAPIHEGARHIPKSVYRSDADKRIRRRLPGRAREGEQGTKS